MSGFIRNVGLLPLVSITWAKLMRDQLCKNLKFTNVKLLTSAISALVLGRTPARVVERSIITGSAVLTRIRRAIIPVYSYKDKKTCKLRFYRLIVHLH